MKNFFVNTKKCLSYRQIVEACFRGILRREPDNTTSYYASALEKEEITLQGLCELFTSLPEFYERCKPSDRKAALASIYANGSLAKGNPDIFRILKKNLIFWHFPKCAGTSLSIAIAEKLHPLQFGQWSEFRKQKTIRLPTQSFYSRHYTWAQFVEVPKPAVTISILRDPKERLRSLFSFFCTIRPTQNENRFNEAIIAANKGEDYFFSVKNNKVLNVIDNAICRDLTDTFVDSNGNDNLRKSPTKIINLAFQRIMKFDALCFVEEIEKNKGILPLRFRNTLKNKLDLKISKIHIANKTFNKKVLANTNEKSIKTFTELDNSLCEKIHEALNIKM